MTTVVTLCSANYLAHAKTLGGSLAEHNPNYHFVVGLVDRVPKALAPSFWHPFEMIAVEELGIPAFWDMVQRYDIVELNTAVKPFFIDYLYRRNPETEAVIYLDPDIFVYASLDPLLRMLGEQRIIVTPHSVTYDNTKTSIYYEQQMLAMGLYNLGFLATSRSETTAAFLAWWQERLQNHCYYHPGAGKFVDQLWMTLAPMFFHVRVEKDPGYNMAYWNHHERHLSRVGDYYLVNGEHRLRFYHFSGYDPTKPELVMSRTQVPLMTFSERPDLKPVYDGYGSRLLENGYHTVKGLRWLIPRRPPTLTRKRAAKEGLRRVLRAAPRGVQSRLKHAAQLTLNALK